ncbi:MAG: hypothetical protein K1V95_00445 [Eubacterium sp.]
MNFTKKDYKKRYNIEAYSLAPTAFDKLPNSSIGLYWGEGHGSSRIINKKKIVKCAFEMIPDGMTLTMRHPKYITLCLLNTKNRHLCTMTFWLERSIHGV